MGTPKVFLVQIVQAVQTVQIVSEPERLERLERLERFERRLRSYCRQNFLTQEVDLLVPIGVAKTQVINDMVETVLFVFLGVLDNVFGLAG
jgi:hypothetical protein